MAIKVLAGAPMGKSPECHEFYECFEMLDLPEGSVRRYARGGNIPGNLNDLVDSALGYECSHLFIVENDSVFSADTVNKLLAHDVPVVAGLCRQRDSPFRSYVYKGVDASNDGLHWYTLQPTDRGLIKVDATGMGGILINTEVFKKLKRPYFHHYYVMEEYHGQDIVFGRSLVDAGIDVYCDTDVIIGHVTQCMIGSAFDAKTGWNVVFKVHEATLGTPQQ